MFQNAQTRKLSQRCMRHSYDRNFISTKPMWHRSYIIYDIIHAMCDGPSLMIIINSVSGRNWPVWLKGSFRLKIFLNAAKIINANFSKQKDFALVSYLKISIWLPVTVSPIHVLDFLESQVFQKRFLFEDFSFSFFRLLKTKKSYSCGYAVLGHLRDLDYLKILFGLKNSGYYKKEDEV